MDECVPGDGMRLQKKILVGFGSATFINIWIAKSEKVHFFVN